MYDIPLALENWLSTLQSWKPGLHVVYLKGVDTRTSTPAERMSKNEFLQALAALKTRHRTAPVERSHFRTGSPTLGVFGTVTYRPYHQGWIAEVKVRVLTLDQAWANYMHYKGPPGLSPIVLEGPRDYNLARLDLDWNLDEVIRENPDERSFWVSVTRTGDWSFSPEAPKGRKGRSFKEYTLARGAEHFVCRPYLLAHFERVLWGVQFVSYARMDLQQTVVFEVTRLNTLEMLYYGSTGELP